MCIRISVHSVRSIPADCGIVCMPEEVVVVPDVDLLRTS